MDGTGLLGLIIYQDHLFPLKVHLWKGPKGRDLFSIYLPPGATCYRWAEFAEHWLTACICLCNQQHWSSKGLGLGCITLNVSLRFQHPKQMQNTNQHPLANESQLGATRFIVGACLADRFYLKPLSGSRRHARIFVPPRPRMQGPWEKRREHTCTLNNPFNASFIPQNYGVISHYRFSVHMCSLHAGCIPCTG